MANWVMPPLVWKRPEHPRWLIACTAGLLLSIAVGGFSFAVLAIFAVIFVVGFVLLGDDGQETDDDFWWSRYPAAVEAGGAGHSDVVDYPADPDEPFTETTDAASHAAGDAAEAPARETDETPAETPAEIPAEAAEDAAEEAPDSGADGTADTDVEDRSDEVADELLEEDVESRTSG